VDRSEIEKAWMILKALMEQEDAVEGDFQRWFEAHSVGFASYGYQRAIPKPHLETPDGRVFQPDFLAQRTDGMWEIVEIKRPDTRILKNAERRQTFYASFESYIAQCNEYQEFFLDSINRERVRATYGIDILHPPDALLVAGMDEGLEKPRVHAILARRVLRIRFQTYDDVSALLDFMRTIHFGKFENLPGLSVHFLIRFPDLKPGHYLLDVGVDERRDRVSVAVGQDGTLGLKVIDSLGRPHAIAIRGVASRVGTDRFEYLAFEFGRDESHAALSIEVNGIVEAWTAYENQHVPIEVSEHYVIGSDLRGVQQTNMQVAELLEYNRTLTLRERLDFRQYFAGKSEGGVLPEVQAFPQ